MILLWGVPGDAPFDDVADALGRFDADAFVLDQRGVREATLTQDGGRGTIVAADASVELGDVRAAYIRPQASTERTRQADAALVAWADLARAGVVNRPAAMAANNSKPYQLSLIARSGFDVPDTIVTTDAERVRQFHSRHGRIVYKSISGVRSIVAQIRDRQLERLSDVSSGPTQFQEWVPGDDVRVHVVGEQVLATLVRSDADDYRYPASEGSTIELEETTLPDEMADLCRRTAHAMGLHLAGLDLRRTPDGRWFCFEVNPSPAFTFYEGATGQPIADAVAALLIRFDATRAARTAP